jgi:hypothetical protein
MPDVPRAARTERSPIRLATPYLELEARSIPIVVRSRKTRQDVRLGSVVVPPARIVGDTDALDWRPDAPLLAIRTRGFSNASKRLARRTSSGVTTLTSQHDGPVSADEVRFALGGKLRTDTSPLQRRRGTRNATSCQ